MMAFSILQIGLRDVLSDIPRDVSALVVYGILILFACLIWAGSRRGGRRRPDDSGPKGSP